MDNLQKLAKHYKVFPDTCSLMCQNAQEFFINKFRIHLRNYGEKIIIPLRVIEELERLEKNGKSKVNTRKAKEIIWQYQQESLVNIHGETSDPFPDGLFQTVFAKFRIKYNLVLITQDRNLAIDILRLHESKSVRSSKQLKVFRIDAHGNLQNWQGKIKC